MRVWTVAALIAGASATTPASEVAALHDFYGALGGDGWLDSDGWNSARDPCDGSEPWYGITCETNASYSNMTRRHRARALRPKEVSKRVHYFITRTCH